MFLLSPALKTWRERKVAEIVGGKNAIITTTLSLDYKENSIYIFLIFCLGNDNFTIAPNFI